jgi:hypothetical protein
VLQNRGREASGAPHFSIQPQANFRLLYAYFCSATLAILLYSSLAHTAILLDSFRDPVGPDLNSCIHFKRTHNMHDELKKDGLRQFVKSLTAALLQQRRRDSTVLFPPFRMDGRVRTLLLAHGGRSSLRHYIQAGRMRTFRLTTCQSLLKFKAQRCCFMMASITRRCR